MTLLAPTPAAIHPKEYTAAHISYATIAEVAGRGQTPHNAPEQVGARRSIRVSVAMEAEMARRLGAFARPGMQSVAAAVPMTTGGYLGAPIKRL